jgi:hypothetical protein
MRQMGWIFLGMLLFPPLPGAFAAGPAPECATFPGEPPLQVCTQVKEKMKVGRSTKYRIWVEGTRERVEIRVHNSSPDVIRLKGGDDQVVRTSGGRSNDVEIKVKALRVGSSSLGAHPYSKDVREEAARIATVIAPKLAALEARFSRERRALPVRPAPEAVAGLLDRTERSLLEILSYRELAALRDSVTAELRQARAGARRALSLSKPQRGVVLAALQSPSPPAPESALERIARLLARLTEISRERELIVDLCIVSQPKSAAVVRLHPQSYPEGKRETRTAGKIALFRGLYVYQAELGRSRIRCVPDPKRDSLESCAPLDLLYNSQPVLACDFGPGNCALRSQPVSACQ